MSIKYDSDFIVYTRMEYNDQMGYEVSDDQWRLFTLNLKKNVEPIVDKCVELSKAVYRP